MLRLFNNQIPLVLQMCEFFKKNKTSTAMLIPDTIIIDFTKCRLPVADFLNVFLLPEKMDILLLA